MSTSTQAPVAPTAAPLATYVDPTARVDLMPPEVLAARSVRAVQRKLVLLLLLVVVAIVAATMWFRLEQSEIKDELAAEVSTGAALRTGQAEYAEIPRIQSEVSAIDRTLAELMVDDVAWDTQLLALATPAMGEIELTGVTMSLISAGAVESAEAAEGSTGVLDASGAEHIGVLTITGQAPSHDAVAAWVASLREVDGFRVPYILGSRVVTEGGAAIDFAVEVTLDGTARTLRYEAPAAAAPTTEGEGG